MSGAKKVFKSVASALTFGASDSLFKPEPDEPKKKEPEVAPVADDVASRQESMRKMMRRGNKGRASTMLSNSGLG